MSGGDLMNSKNTEQEAAMRQADVVIAWELGGGLGHLGRLRPLAEQLIQRGQRVAFLVRDVRYCPLIFRGTEILWY